MQAHRLVVEFVGQTFSSTQEIQGRLCPVITGANLCPGITLALIGCPHGQQVPDGHILDRLFASF